MKKFDYTLNYKDLNLREKSELYRVWKWEQWVLLVESYKSEIFPFWRFKTPKIAEKSSQKIFELFLEYKEKWDFIGMDMARKCLQMWWTRSHRYTNHKSGKKYSDENLEKPKKFQKFQNILMKEIKNILLQQKQKKFFRKKLTL